MAPPEVSILVSVFHEQRVIGFFSVFSETLNGLATRQALLLALAES
jgi:hypothetical protein